LEKQKLKAIYGVLERQFRLYFQRAEKKGNPAENLLSLLERRLDNTIYRLGFASSRTQARQVVRHGHIIVNQRKVDIPSFTVKSGDLIGVRDKSRKLQVIKEGLENKDPAAVVGWLELDKERLAGKILRLPTIEDTGDIPANPRLVVELYSK
jgi:small subunit ribosomal protein S4